MLGIGRPGFETPAGQPALDQDPVVAERRRQWERLTIRHHAARCSGGGRVFPDLTALLAARRKLESSAGHVIAREQLHRQAKAWAKAHQLAEPQPARAPGASGGPADPSVLGGMPFR